MTVSRPLLDDVIDPAWGDAVADAINRGAVSGGTGAPSGTGVNGETYYDSTNQRFYRSDGAGWVVMMEPIQSYSSVASSTGGTITSSSTVFRYTRQNGWLEFLYGVSITTLGTATGVIAFPLPVAADATALASQAIGFGHVGAISVMAYIGASASTGNIAYYNGTFPGADGSQTNIAGRYRMASRYS